MTSRHLAATRSQEQTRYHNGLPEGWNRDRFRQLCKSYALQKGCSAQCIVTLETIIDIVPPTAFTNPCREPLCYARQETLIANRGLTERSAYNHEIKLEEIGLIERRLDANGGRSRKKNRGLLLTPALNLIGDMLDLEEKMHAANQLHDHLRGERSTLYRHVKASITVLLTMNRTQKAVEALLEEFRSWPRSDRLKYMSLQGLRSHVEEARDLLKELQKHIEIQTDFSGEPERSFGSHTKERIEDEIMSCNADGEKRTSAKASDIVSSGTEPGGSVQCIEKDDDESGVTDNTKSIPRVNNGTVYELASPELQMHIDIAGCGPPNPDPSLYSIEIGVANRLKEFGTNVSAWHEAIGTIGLMGAVLAALITDARLTDTRKPPIANPGGYFRGMIRKSETGELNLIGGLMGLIARRAREAEVQNQFDPDRQSLNLRGE